MQPARTAMPDPISESTDRSDRAAPTSSAPPPATLLQVIEAVLWSFFGVRKGNAMQRDVVTIKAHQVIVVGILLAAVLVATLLILVHFITRAA